MWNALQGATANIANRATRLAADVLETASEELSGAPDASKGLRPQHRRSDSSESKSSTGNPRLAALKARYKGGSNGGQGPLSVSGDYGLRENGGYHSQGFGTSLPHQDKGTFGSPTTPNGNFHGDMPGFDENAELVKVRDQLMRLKSEMVQMSITHDDEQKQREYDFKEQIKDLEKKHRADLAAFQQNPIVAADSAKQIAEKDAEIHALKSQLQSIQQQDVAQAFNLQSAECSIDHSNEELEFLRAELIEKGFSELNTQSVEELIALRDEEIEKLEIQLDAFRSSDPSDALSKLREENAELQSKLQSSSDAAFFDNYDSSTCDKSSNIAELEQTIERLTVECKSLRESAMIPTSAESLAERDTYWSQELEKEQLSHKETQVKLQQLMEEEKERTQVQADEEAKTQRALEEMQSSLEGRDRIWQEELVKGQEELQRARKEIEQLKLQQQQGTSHSEALLESLQHDYSVLQERCRVAEQDLLNEQDIRKSAESHVKAMQKSLESQIAQNDASRGSSQNELEAQKKACADLRQDLQAAQEQLNMEKERLRASEESRSLAEDSLESVNVHASNLQQEIDQLRKSGSNEATASTSTSTQNDIYQQELLDVQKENSSLKQEIADLRQQVHHGEERLQLAMEQEGTPEGTTDVDAVQIMQTRATELELERNRLKEQLNRLKQQMLSMQEDQESSIGWRIDAEVKLAVEEARQKEVEATSQLRKRIAELEGILDSQGGSEQRLQEACKQKDMEINNLQSVLGELTFHSEAAEKLRRELREAKQKIEELKEALENEKSEVAEAQSSRRAAESSADRAHKAADVAKEKESVLEGEIINLKRALLESSSRVSSMNQDADAMIDRRLVVKLLVTYLERRNSREALELMAKMLHFTDEEKKRVGLDGSKRGLVGALAGGTMAIVRGGVSVATLGMYGQSKTNVKPGESLADRWVEFLLKEAEVGAENRRDFRQDPLTLLKDEDPFGTKSPTAISQITGMNNNDDAGYTIDKLPSSRSMIDPSPIISGTFPGVQAPQGQSRAQPPSPPLQTVRQGVPPYSAPLQDFAKYEASPRANYTDRTSPLPQYQPRPLNGVVQHIPTNGGSPLPSFPTPQTYSPKVSNSGFKMSSNGGSVPSLRDYMAKYHSTN